MCFTSLVWHACGKTHTRAMPWLAVACCCHCRRSGKRMRCVSIMRKIQVSFFVIAWNEAEGTQTKPNECAWFLLCIRQWASEKCGKMTINGLLTTITHTPPHLPPSFPSNALCSLSPLSHSACTTAASSNEEHEMGYKCCLNGAIFVYLSQWNVFGPQMSTHAQNALRFVTLGCAWC